MTSAAIAGGGPENVMLLVNADSERSKTIANHYIRLRRIPASNVLYLRWPGGLEACKLASFQRLILKPTLEAISERRLAMQIDYIVYSSDFPWRVNMREFYPDEKFPQQLKPVAALTGVTYLWQYVETKQPSIVSLRTNWYCSQATDENLASCRQLGNPLAKAFRYFYLWTREGKRTTDIKRGQRYLISTMLGVTSGRGNTVDEVIQYLQRSVWADATHPRGTFYFAKHGGVRSVSRHHCFAAATARLRQLGTQAEVLETRFPKNRADVLGIVSGVAEFDLANSGNSLLPGAIGDNLTSYGGALDRGTGQTPLSEFLRHGAAGAVGTVFEPFNIQAKFPLPTWPIYYVQGCSLGESIYRSVSGPYQLLVVGDPLCQPWAVPPTVKVEGVLPGDEVQGELVLHPHASTIDGRSIRYLEVYVDGALQARFRPQEEYKLDTQEWADGYHELRVVAVDSHPTESQGRLIIPIQVRNHNKSIEFSVTPTGSVSSAAQLQFSAKQENAQSIEYLHHGRVIGRSTGEQGTLEVIAGTLGRGPVAVWARSEGAHPAVSAPVWLQIE